jgi:hypothetical protein
MENLRAAVESDLHESVEGEFSSRVIITYPDDGYTQEYSVTNPDEYLRGTFRKFTLDLNPETGETVQVNIPNLVLRIKSLYAEIEAGKNYFLKVQDPISEEWESYIQSPTKAPVNGKDIGFVRLYMQRIENDSGEEVLDDVLSYD